MTTRSKLRSFWDAFLYGLRGGLVQDALWDLRMWWRRRAMRRAFEFMPLCRPFYDMASPWGMLDREHVVQVALQFGYTAAAIEHIRPIYGPPVDIYARPWTPE